MLPLRYPRLWWLLGWLLVVAVVVGSLLPSQAIAGVEAIGDKFLHALAYFVMMLWFAGLYPRERHVWIAAGLLVLGTALDVLQGATETRTFDLRDIAADACGILLGLLLARFLLAGWCLKLERLLVATGS